MRGSYFLELLPRRQAHPATFAHIKLCSLTFLIFAFHFHAGKSGITHIEYPPNGIAGKEMLARDYANAKKFGAPDMMEWFEEEAQDLLKRLGAAATPATVERHQETTAF